VAAAVVVALLAAGCHSGAASGAGPHTRAYYIAADEVAWNYTPSGINMITGQPFDAAANKYVQSGPDRIGSTYTKCLYHGYTDATFTHQLERSASEQYLGLLGPVIKAQVGDTIKVTFRNNCSFPASIHPHGVFYTKKDEGTPYDDGRSAADKVGDAVAFHQQYVYTWQVPERAGPGPMDSSSVMWMYHSHTDETADTYAGLIGPMEITARGKARADGSPNDVDREFFALFMVIDENSSPYLEAERTKLATPPAAADANFQGSNRVRLMRKSLEELAFSRVVTHRAMIPTGEFEGHANSLHPRRDHCPARLLRDSRPSNSTNSLTVSESASFGITDEADHGN
jgi:hypothetical protein